MKSSVSALVFVGALACGRVNQTDSVDAAITSPDAIVPDAVVPPDASVPPDGQPPDADPTVPDGGTEPPQGMVHVPAGVFWRGCNSTVANEYACTAAQSANEVPYREITLTAYYIDKTEVTQAAYAECVAAVACTAPAPVDEVWKEEAGYDPAQKPDHPVSNVTWAQARTYCEFRGKRLPTEAEWEKAARGTDGRLFPWGNGAFACGQANTHACPDTDGTHAVGSHPTDTSPYGAIDMGGNVREWVNDLYQPDYYSVSPLVDPPGPLSGTGRVSKGSSFAHSWNGARPADRSAAGAVADYTLGFRCAKSL